MGHSANSPKKIIDTDFLALLCKIIESFSPNNIKNGMPIGNLTSQLFANIYLNEFDQYIKHILKIKHYIRYMDDFIILSTNKYFLIDLILKIKNYLKENLDLELHPNKVKIVNLNQGIDFLGYILFPYYILPRTKTKKRLLKKIRVKIEDYKKGLISSESLYQTIQSYFGYLQHSNAYKLTEKIKHMIYSELET